MMKKIFFLALLFLSLTACNFPALQPQPDEFGAALDATNTATGNIEKTTPTPTNPNQAPSGSSDPIPPLDPEAIIITMLDMKTTSAGWAFGGEQDPGEHVLYTTDGGQSWHDVTPPELPDADGNSKIPAGYFLDENVGWVTFDPVERFNVPAEPIVWFTENAGANWQAIGKLDNSGLLEEDYEVKFVEFSDAQHGWIMTHIGAGMSHRYVALFATTDGGKYWERLIDPFKDTSMQLCEKTGMSFADSKLGLITLDCFGVITGAQVLHTLDGGMTWVQGIISLDFLGETTKTNQPYCVTHSPQAVYIAETYATTLQLNLTCKTNVDNQWIDQSFILFSNDLGLNWTFMPYIGGPIQRVPPTPLAYSSDDILFSLGKEITNFPADLKTDPVPVKKTVWNGQFSFVGSDRLWAVARNDGEIALVYSTDGGKTLKIIEAIIID